MRTSRNTPGLMMNIPSIFDDFLGGSVSTMNHAAAVNIVKGENDYQIELVAPGFNKDDFEIKVENNELTISAKIEKVESEKEKNYSRREFVKRAFKRTFTLPENEINEDEIKANYSNGILVLSLPKREEALPKAPKQIAIQ